ncbi:basic blue protein [Canna indica]|uniref:Basic blue protein n=1 Tax=Canna indica TaxID=4628 RepID=A0AAQ3Q691_9LILI|nr:basic blue protein [Canna indica]WOL04384.1 basic blue protein [Canna indica]
MAMRRGSLSAAMLVALLLAVSSPVHSDASTHVVGDSQGWGFSVSYADWAKSRSFAAGDTMVFNYQQGVHNVAPVSAAGYRSCKASVSAATTGNDKFTLKRGANYFICSIPSHCAAGMKIQVIAN